jgi:hypothetical protein
MPSVEELMSIVDYSRSNPSIDIAYFPLQTSSNVWSGSPSAYALGLSDTYRISFSYGYSGKWSRYDFLAVRLVRGGQ